MPDRDYVEQLAQQRFQGRFRNEFLAAIDRLTEDFPFERIVSLIEQGDIEAAVSAVGLDPDAFPEMKATNAAALAAAGEETAKVMPRKLSPDGNRIQMTFEPGNPRAERAVDELNTGLMRGLNGGPAITEEGKTAVRNHIRQGLQNGDNPRTIARRMRGSWDAQAKAYRGGMIGLTDTQAGHVRNAEEQLRSGDPRELRKYLNRKLRDKRFDRSVIKAINEGTAVPEKTINNAVSGYHRKYVKFRSEVVARDQSLSALTRGQEESIDQAIQDGFVAEEQVVKEWITAGDDRVRNAHRMIPQMNRGGVRRQQSFDTPLGPLRFPRDPQGSAANTIQCRCTLAIRVDQREGVSV